MKKTILLFLILGSTLFSFGQKAQLDFLTYKIPSKANVYEDTWFTIIEKNDQMFMILMASQTCKTDDDIEFSFNPDTTKEFTDVTIEDFSFSVQSGTLYDNTDYVEAEKYIYVEGNLFITIYRNMTTTDDQTFEKFVKSFKIDKKALEWQNFENDFFTISLPGKGYIETQVDTEIDFFDYYTTDFGANNFSLTISPFIDADDIDNILGNNFVFYEIINGFLYTAHYQNEGGFQLNENFTSNLEQGFEPKNNQPKGNVIDGSLSTQHSLLLNHWLFVETADSIVLWDVKHNKNYASYPKLTGKSTSAAVIDNEYTYIADKKGNIELFYFMNEEPLKVKIEGHSDKINKIRYIYEIGIVSCSDDKTLIINSTEFHQGIPSLICEGHKDAVTCFDGYKDEIVSGSKDKTIKAWNKNGELKSTHKIHDDEITALSYIDFKTVISASKDNTVKVLNYEKDEVLETFDIKNGYVTCFSEITFGFEGYKNYIAMGTSSGEVLILDRKTLKIKERFFNTRKAIKFVRFYEEGVMYVNEDNEINYSRFDNQ